MSSVKLSPGGGVSVSPRSPSSRRGDESDDDDYASSAAGSKASRGKKVQHAAAGPVQSFARASLDQHISQGLMVADASKPGSFLTFQKLCTAIEFEPSGNAKTAQIKRVLKRDTPHLYTFARLLLPGKKIDHRVYRMSDKSLVKIFARVLNVSSENLMTEFKEGTHAGNISGLLHTEFVTTCPDQPQQSTLSLLEVDQYLDEFAQLTKEEDQVRLFRKIVKTCTHNDLKFLVRLLKKDLRIGAGPKPVLDALEAGAYNAFKIVSDLKTIVTQIVKAPKGAVTKFALGIQLMTPCKPMLAEACKSYEAAVKKCPNGIFAEIKYDGERIQVHYDAKTGTFNFFSRSLKPLAPHKVQHIRDYLPQACKGDDSAAAGAGAGAYSLAPPFAAAKAPSKKAGAPSMILDGEILLWDTQRKIYLPFGTLGVHKKQAFNNATVCLVIFDMLYLDEQSLTETPMATRRQLMEKHVQVIPGRIHLSESQEVKDAVDLEVQMRRVLDEGLEGLVLKDTQGLYVPGMRRWLKMKKDYLAKGAMADSADLVVLGGFYGSGSKGGVISTFLMGAWDPVSKQWKTVVKVGNGFTDSQLEDLQNELKMKIINGPNEVPSWLDVKNECVPDQVVNDPFQSPVWEISGAQFSLSKRHTANSISIRFPRVTKVRDDKTWKEATDVNRLRTLVGISRLSDDALLEALNLKRATGPMKMVAGAGADAGGKKVRGVPTSPKKSPASPKKAKKRKNAGDDSDDEEEVLSGLRPMCKYGATCYRTKNPAHLAQFRHPHIGQGADDYDPDFVVDGPTEDELRAAGLGDSDDDMDGLDVSNVIQGRHKRRAAAKKVNYAEADSDDEDDDENNDDDADFDAENPDDMLDVDADAGRMVEEEVEETKQSKPRCKYWDKCYRKNPAHLAEFLHPRDLESATNKEERAGAANGIPKDSEEDRTTKKRRLPGDSPAVSTKKESDFTDTAAPTPTPTSAPLDKLSAGVGDWAVPDEDDDDDLEDMKPATASSAAAADVVEKKTMKRTSSMDEVLNGLPDIFSGLDCFIDTDSVPKERVSIIRRFFVAYDGELSKTVTSRTTHILTDGVWDERLQAMTSLNEDAVVVRSEWATASIKAKKLQNEADYLVMMD